MIRPARSLSTAEVDFDQADEAAPEALEVLGGFTPPNSALLIAVMMMVFEPIVM